jgi:hypothetical protein
MKTSFAVTEKNILTRKFGGSNAQGVATPYTSGTFFLWFEPLPPLLMTYLESSGLGDISQVQKILAASCLSVTPAGNSLESIEFTGLGGVKWTVPGALTPTTEFSAKFLEFSKTPILNIFHSWIKIIRDYRLGITDVLLDSDAGDGFTKDKYAGTAYYWTTAPDGANVEYYVCYDGVYPTKDPQDLYSGDVETVGRLDVDMTFKFDTMWHEDWVKTKCEGFAGAFNTAGQAIKAYSY